MQTTSSNPTLHPILLAGGALLLLVGCPADLGARAGQPDSGKPGAHDDAGLGRDAGLDASVLLDAAVLPDAAVALDAALPELDASPPLRCPQAPSGPPAAVWPADPPYEMGVVQAVADERPDLLAASCVDTGGSNEFLFEVVRRLRAIDDRWGMNWKRGNEGDLSQDVVDYLWGEGPCEGNSDVYIIDVIGGHCGDAPGAAFIDVTGATLEGGTIGRWTLAGEDL